MAPTGRSTVKSETFRAAAKRLLDVDRGVEIFVPAHGNVERPVGGGGWVDVQMWVPEEEAAKEAADVVVEKP